MRARQRGYTSCIFRLTRVAGIEDSHKRPAFERETARQRFCFLDCKGMQWHNPHLSIFGSHESQSNIDVGKPRNRKRPTQ